MSFDNDRKSSKGPSGRDDSSDLGYYLGTLRDDPLLTPEQELEMGRIVQAGLRAAQDTLVALLRDDAKILSGRKIVDDDAYRAAAARRREFNPLGLMGSKLKAHVVALSVGQHSGFSVLKLFGEPVALQTAEQFVRSNRRLVVTIAKPQQGKRYMSLADLIQEGNLGLVTAVLRFDPARKLRFSTYATWWIRHAINRAKADKGRLIRLPVHAIDFAAKVEKRSRILTAELGRVPALQELVASLNVPNGKIESLLPHFQLPISIDQDAHNEDDGAATGHQILADERDSPEVELARDEIVDALQSLIPLLSPIEKNVICQRFGLGGNDERTYREIGEAYGLSRERIRQIQNKALGKLKKALSRKGVRGS